MKKDLNRNDLCYCGSGKKYKNCHMGKPTAEKANKSFIIIGALAVIVVMAAISVFFSVQESPQKNNRTTTNPVSAPVAPPPGEAPEGKVWSSEHGHWHDK